MTQKKESRNMAPAGRPPDRQPRVSGQAYLVIREEEVIRPGLRESFQPHRKASAHAAGERNHAASTCYCLALRHGDFAALNCTVFPSETQILSTEGLRLSHPHSRIE